MKSKYNDVDLFGKRTGWKTQYLEDELKDLEIDQEANPYAGFGHCSHESITLNKFELEDSILDQIRAYLIPLRAQCNKHLVAGLVRIFEHGGLAKHTFSRRSKYNFFKIVPDWDVL